MEDEENQEFIAANQVQNIPTFVMYKGHFLERMIGVTLIK